MLTPAVPFDAGKLKLQLNYRIQQSFLRDWSFPSGESERKKRLPAFNALSSSILMLKVAGPSEMVCGSKLLFVLPK